MQAIHEKYDVVVKHLIEEGYAEDKENADEIIKGMSNQWFDLITEEPKKSPISAEKK